MVALIGLLMLSWFTPLNVLEFIIRPTAWVGGAVAGVSLWEMIYSAGIF